MSTSEDFQDIENDITSLEQEISALQERHDSLYREVAVFEAENKHKNLPKPVLPQKLSTNIHNDHNNDAPPLIRYSPFDESIETYFQEHSSEPEPISLSASNDSILKRIQLKTEAGILALHESIMRFGGITAFPINDSLYDKENDDLLGLRFDVMSHTSFQFLKPHYIILRKRVHISKSSSDSVKHWQIFRYTTPVYVPLDKFSSMLAQDDVAYGLQLFVEKVREYLILIQFKFDVLEQISNFNYSSIYNSSSAKQVIIRVDKDLDCTRVQLRIEVMSESTTTSHHIDLVCGLTDVRSVESSSLGDSHTIFIENIMVGTSFQDLSSKFKSALSYLQKHGVL